MLGGLPVSKKEELLKKIKELEEADKALRERKAADDKPKKLQTGMPLGCWMWVAFFIWLIYYGIKKYS